MKTRLSLLIAGILLLFSSTSFAWFGNNGWGNNGGNNWPSWTPMYWAEEVFDNNNNYGYPGYGGGYPGYGGGYPGYGGGYPGYGGYAPYGGYAQPGYGYPGYGGYPGGHGFPGGWGW